MRKICLAGAVLVALIVPTGSTAVPPLSSNNVEFVANIPDVPAVGGRIVGKYLYMSTLQGLRIYDISLGIPIPVGAFELPHWENENLDTNGKIALISADNVTGNVSVLFIFDVSIPQAPLLLSAIRLPRDGHTTSCVKDCQFAWSSGGDVVDLRDPSKPKILGTAPVGGHDTNVDAAGLAWTGGGAVYDTTTYGSAPLNPTLVTYGNFGWHNSLRPNAEMATPTGMADGNIDPGELVIGTDEYWLLNSCSNEGPFLTSWYHTVNGSPTITPLDSYQVGSGSILDGRKPGRATATCSSHWFDFRDNVVADSWYEQGTRFLDVSNPRDIKQIGWFMPGATMSWASIFNDVPDGPTAGRYVYVFDGVRGIDVLRWKGTAGGSANVDGPRLVPTQTFATEPHPTYGWACRNRSADTQR